MSTWLSDPAGEQPVLSTGKARVFLKTILPRGAMITKRGGKGHEFWGHPYEPTAQYNHEGSGSNRPPYVPWRLEVEAPRGSRLNYFMHVFEIGEEAQAVMSEAELVIEDGWLGVSLDQAGTPVRVLFSEQGPLDARITVGQAAEDRITPEGTE